MRPLSECRVAAQTQSVREVLAQGTRSPRRTGAIMLTNEHGRLAGIFTDSDLARLFERHRDAAVDGPIRDVMTPNPLTVPQGSMMVDAVGIMAERKISELPVIDAEMRPIGLLDITDVLGLFPDVEPLFVPTMETPIVLPFGGAAASPSGRSAGSR
jgi:arabinose-5-phosphate isomerase